MYYTYDADAQRVSKDNGTDVTSYIRGADGQTIATYVNGTVDKWNLISGGDIVGTAENGSAFIEYFIKDHLGSTRAIENNINSPVAYYDFYPFGKLMPGRYTTSNDDRYKFTGHELDSDAGIDLSYAGARYLDSEIGTWLSVDPMVDDYPGLSPYNYTLNSPMNFTDPNGMNAIAVKFDYDVYGNEYVVLEEGDTIFDLIEFMRENGLDRVDFGEQDSFDDNGYAIPGAVGSTGNVSLSKAYNTGYPGAALPWWVDGSPSGKIKAGVRLTRSGAFFNALLALVKGRKATLTKGTLYHIIKNHGFNRGASWKGKFLKGLDLSTLEAMIQKTVARSNKLPNTRGRPGNTFIYDFGKTIGTSGGKSVSKLKVVVINGKVRTAYPVK